MSLFADLVEHQASTRPDQSSHVFLDARVREVDSLDWLEFARRVRSVAAGLRERGLVGRRVILLCPWGEPFVVSLWACLYAGVVPVPAPLDTFERSLGRAGAITASARPAAAIVAEATAGLATRAAPGVPQLDYAELRRTGAPTAFSVARGASEHALLQFTSGSTANPRGVVLTGDNVDANCRAIIAAYDLTAADIGVSWLPMHHDMGLIGHVLVPVYTGIRSILMPSLGFLQRPDRWLQAIDRYRGSVSAAPAFAFEYCQRRVRPDVLAGLDLSCWRVAICGAEPIDGRTLDAFTERLAANGFDGRAIRPSYGLAEATLLVTAGRWQPLHEPAAAPVAASVDAGMKPVGCGAAVLGVELAVVDPQTGRFRTDAESGEVVLRGRSITPGYLDPERDAASLGARELAPVDAGRSWYRTGDLGRIVGGELFLTGRIDDLMQVRGRNIHASEVEAVVARAHPALEAGRCAAIGVALEGTAALVVLAEVPRAAAGDAAVEQAIRRDLAETLEIVPHAIVLSSVGSLPRTTSGKIRRRQCAEDYIGRDRGALPAATGVDGVPSLHEAPS